MDSASQSWRDWPPISILIGAGTPGRRRADAIVHHPVVQRMLRSYGEQGGWKIEFHEDADRYVGKGVPQAILFVDSLSELQNITARRPLARVRVYLLGPDDECLAEEAELYGVKALLTCPDHWFDLRQSS